MEIDNEIIEDDTTVIEFIEIPPSIWVDTLEALQFPQAIIEEQRTEQAQWQ